MRQWCKAHPKAVLLGYLAAYLVCFFLMERVLKPRYIIHCFLDDYIPFWEAALVPYSLWFLWIPLSLLYFYKRNERDFWRLCRLMIFGTICCLVLYVVFPNGLDLRRPIIADNILAALVVLLRQVDTPTNVCPSLHVYNSMAILLVMLSGESTAGKKGLRLANGVLCASVLASTLLLQQHSVVDLVTAVGLSLVMNHVDKRLACRGGADQTAVSFCLKQ